MVPKTRKPLPGRRAVLAARHIARLVGAAPRVQAVPEQEGLVVLDVGLASRHVRTASTGLRVDGAPMFARLEGAALIASPAVPAQVSSTVLDTLSAAWLLRLDVKDELQAYSRVASVLHPTAPG